ncbi:MAG: flagellar biosynthesis protein FlhA [Geminicoccaceae bacterium]|nr:flagellar biosynthesis protein FlhA [Geminicoccaceae bacterium]MCX8101106.1 flagellar biosynthesis protein FlhA [Geminicoccaceae bacterium]MDW8370191.1 flagellar biosynthesis protein FlhA [Geminicoccaceae bacterium]
MASLRLGSGGWAGLARALQQGDVLLGLGVVAILVVLILPLPPLLLDLLLAISISLSVLVLLTALFIEKPLDFNSFPTVLLIATMLRLALNLASTRLILAEGHGGPAAAGQVIAAFGGFIMQGSFVIGLIVFAILVIVNFVVITKGSGRIAEVAARFSLDAMPGKQMAIDADLSAGLIDEATARARRRALEEESAFFGAMDGAAKFVRGDAIAGLLITAINLAAGLLIGVGQMGLSFAEAARTYSLLTVGDGLVSQIPALFVSVAAGLLVTKAGVTGRADQALLSQFGAYPRAFGVTAGLAGALALLPGLPAVPFLALAAGAGWLATRSRPRSAPASEPVAAAPTRPQPAAEEGVAAALAIDPIRLELGYGLLPLIDEAQGGRLTDQIRALRRQLAQELGFVLPSVRIQDNIQLPSNTYVVRIKELEGGRGELRPAALLVMDPLGRPIELPGEETTEPTFGLQAKWIAPTLREEAIARGCTVVDPATVLTTHLTEVIKEYLAELLTFAETQKLLKDLGEDYQKLLADLVPARITTGGIQRVLQGLLAERVSIRDLKLILEAIAEAVGHTQNIVLVIEHVRSRLARQISTACTGPAGYIPVLSLSAEWEQAFAEALVGQGEERQLALAPSRLQDFIRAVRDAFEAQALKGELPVLVTSPQIRPYVRSIVERFRPATVVLSHNEIHPKARLKALGQV